MSKTAPRLYLNIPGVLLAPEPPFAQTTEFMGSRYVPEVVKRLGETGMELAWLTGLPAETVHAVETELGIQGRIIPHMVPDHHSYRWKLLALARDIRLRPVPFVWVDTGIRRDHREWAEQRLRVPQWHIHPFALRGLTDLSLRVIESFAQTYSGDDPNPSSLQSHP